MFLANLISISAFIFPRFQPQRQNRPPNAKIGARKVTPHGLKNASGKTAALAPVVLVSILCDEAHESSEYVPSNRYEGNEQRLVSLD